MKIYKEMKEQIIKSLEDDLNGNKCTKCGKLSLQFFVDIVDDQIEAEALCNSCGVRIAVNINQDKESLSSLRNSLESLENAFKGLGKLKL